jgi:hypothetical protein
MEVIKTLDSLKSKERVSQLIPKRKADFSPVSKQQPSTAYKNMYIVVPLLKHSRF